MEQVPKLIRRLESILPEELKKWTPTELKANCGLNKECPKCPRLKKCYKEHILDLDVRIPQSIIDRNIRNVSHSAWVLFTVLCRFALFDKRPWIFGLGTTPKWLNNDQLSHITRISKKHLYEFAQELEAEGLITRRQVLKSGKQPSSYNIYTIVHMVTMREIEELCVK
jgi:hypothetical protein